MADEKTALNSKAKALLEGLLRELRDFNDTVTTVRRRIERLPDPLNDLIVLPLRNAEDLRHGADHVVHALKALDKPEYVLDQLQDARGHFLNLLPDLFMHIDGALLSWCADALSQEGLIDKGRTEEAAVNALVERFAAARLNRTGNRTEAVKEVEAIFEEIFDLAPRVVALTLAEQGKQVVEISKIKRRSVRAETMLKFSLFAFFLGLVAWIL